MRRHVAPPPPAGSAGSNSMRPKPPSVPREPPPAHGSSLAATRPVAPWEAAEAGAQDSLSSEDDVELSMVEPPSAGWLEGGEMLVSVRRNATVLRVKACDHKVIFPRYRQGSATGRFSAIQR
mmetsp:Transcript_92034/g.264833  ORF Transcript_92034/g.264833 Transcript_92034/m.264833 type:complete len:122 (+) Transcript_92034:1-366(+)